jgi:hypothetical protein
MPANAAESSVYEFLSFCNIWQKVASGGAKVIF